MMANCIKKKAFTNDKKQIKIVTKITISPEHLGKLN